MSPDVQKREPELEEKSEEYLDAEPGTEVPESLPRDLREENNFSGVAVRTMNIRAGQSVAETVRTTLGPLGMDKLVVDSEGMGMVTNNGASILKEMDVDFPAAELLVSLASRQEDAVGDGTTASAVLAGALLEGATDLLELGLHPATVVSGYNRAATVAVEAMHDHAIDVDAEDREVLEQIATTSITGKVSEREVELLGDLAVEAALAVRHDGEISLENIEFEKVVGGSMADSELMSGLFLDRERAHEEMPYEVTDADVAVVDQPVTVDETDMDSTVTLTDPEDIDRLVAEKRRRYDELSSSIVETGTDVLITNKTVDERVISALVDADVYLARHVAASDIGKVATATGATVIEDPLEMDADDLGTADYVAEHIVGGDYKTVLRDTAADRIATLILRGGGRTLIDEMHRGFEDSISAVRVALESGAVLPGGGAAEMAAAAEVYDAARSVDSREQLVAEAFVDALEVVPYLLADNAGHDGVDLLTALRTEHDAGNVTASVDAFSGEVVDAMAAGVVEPLPVKTNIVRSAVEAATVLLRIDDIVPTDAQEMEKTGHGGGDIDQELIEYESRSKAGQEWH